MIEVEFMCLDPNCEKCNPRWTTLDDTSEELPIVDEVEDSDEESEDEGN